MDTVVSARLVSVSVLPLIDDALIIAHLCRVVLSAYTPLLAGASVSVLAAISPLILCKACLRASEGGVAPALPSSTRHVIVLVVHEFYNDTSQKYKRQKFDARKREMKGLLGSRTGSSGWLAARLGSGETLETMSQLELVWASFNRVAACRRFMPRSSPTS